MTSINELELNYPNFLIKKVKSHSEDRSLILEHHDMRCCNYKVNLLMLCNNLMDLKKKKSRLRISNSTFWGGKVPKVKEPRKLESKAPKFKSKKVPKCESKRFSIFKQKPPEIPLSFSPFILSANVTTRNHEILGVQGIERSRIAVGSKPKNNWFFGSLIRGLKPKKYREGVKT